MHTTLLIYCSIIAIASALGGSIPLFVKLTHRRTQFILSFVSGVMLGVALLNLLPHSVYVLKDPMLAMGIALIGLLFMFFMVRMFHFHQHDLHVEHSDEEVCGHSCSHESHHDEHQEGGQPDFTWAGLCFGLGVHTLIDGVALATAVTAQGANNWTPAGLAVFLAILLHKPLDALSITSLMSTKGWNSSAKMTVNVLFAAVCPLSALLFMFGLGFVEGEMVDAVMGYALAFSAGIFLCISLGDLLPEVHFHSHDRLQLSGMLLLGVAVAFVIELGHDHDWKTGTGNMEGSTAVSTSLSEEE